MVATGTGGTTTTLVSDDITYIIFQTVTALILTI